MSSTNLELFPDDLFARKGTAAPAGGETKETPDQTVVSLDDAAGARQTAQEDAPAETKAPAKPKARKAKAKAKGRKSAGDGAESEPAASVLAVILRYPHVSLMDL